MPLRRKAQPSPDKGPKGGAPALRSASGKTGGLNLTAHIDLGGEITMLGPRVSGRKAETAGHFGGRELSVHVSRRGRRNPLTSLSERFAGQRRINPVLGAIVETLKWIFFIKPKILIIERYVWSECWANFLLMSMGFTFFMIITSVFTLGEKIFTKNIPP